MPTLKILEANTGLQVTGLRKSYRKRIIIHDISLELKRGEVVALLGPNGSGKTTTFYSIAGLTSSDGGQVKIDGTDVTTMPMYRRARMGLSYLPQETSIFRGLNVEDNLKSVLDISTPLKSERQAKLEKLLSDFRIEHLRRTPALALSGGERRRVEIARTLATDPKYILLDEPFAGVDPISVNDVRNLVSELKGRSIGVLITDHNVRDTLKIVDRAYILNDGRVIVSGLPEDVVNNDNVQRVYLGKDFKIL
jgi:lipopolysaccharide export system ATP-binding protein